MEETFNKKNFGTFKIADLFEKIKTNKIFNKTGTLPATTATLSNNGLGKKISREGSTILKNVFSATANGQGKVFFQPYEFTVLQDSYAFKFKKEELNKNIQKYHMYFLASLNKIFENYNWNNKSVWSRMKTQEIVLPIKKTSNNKDKYTIDDIDFEFMENFIAELKTNNLVELNEYLTVNNFVNYKLSMEEQKVIDLFNNGEIEYGDFYIGNLFEIKRGNISKQLQLIDDNNGITFISQKKENNGFEKKVQLNGNKKFNGKSIIIGRQTGICYYQDNDFITTDGVLVLLNNIIIKNKNIGLFLKTIIMKHLSLYGYSNTVSIKKLKKTKIKLPIKKTSNNKDKYTIDDIDFEFMENFIKAIQKTKIKDIVEYSKQQEKI